MWLSLFFYFLVCVLLAFRMKTTSSQGQDTIMHTRTLSSTLASVPLQIQTHVGQLCGRNLWLNRKNQMAKIERTTSVTLLRSVSVAVENGPSNLSYMQTKQFPPTLFFTVSIFLYFAIIREKEGCGGRGCKLMNNQDRRRTENNDKSQ